MLISPKKWNIIKYKNLLSHKKMANEILIFGDTTLKLKTRYLEFLHCDITC